MRVIYAALPRAVRLILVDDTLVVNNEMRMLALPAVPIFIAATVALTFSAQPAALLTLLAG